MQKNINNKRCAICLKKGCSDHHNGIDQYIYFNKGQCFLSSAGKEIFGEHYLEDIRKEKSIGSLQANAVAKGYSNIAPGYSQRE